MDKTDICVFVFIFINGGVSKRECPIIYIYIYIFTHIYLYICVCVCIFKIWKIGIILIWESASSTARNSLAVFTAKTRGTWRKQVVYFSYIIDIKIQQGLVFLQVVRTGEKPWGTIHQKQMPKSFNIYKNHIPWKALSKFLKLALSKPEIRRFQPGILNIPAKSGSTEAFHGPTKAQLRPN